MKRSLISVLSLLMIAGSATARAEINDVISPFSRYLVAGASAETPNRGDAINVLIEAKFYGIGGETKRFFVVSADGTLNRETNKWDMYSVRFVPVTMIGDHDNLVNLQFAGAEFEKSLRFGLNRSVNIKAMEVEAAGDAAHHILFAKMALNLLGAQITTLENQSQEIGMRFGGMEVGGGIRLPLNESVVLEWQLLDVSMDVGQVYEDVQYSTRLSLKAGSALTAYIEAGQRQLLDTKAVHEFDRSGETIRAGVIFGIGGKHGH
jgi:hypothetical protein